MAKKKHGNERMRTMEAVRCRLDWAELGWTGWTAIGGGGGGSEMKEKREWPRRVRGQSVGNDTRLEGQDGPVSSKKRREWDDRGGRWKEDGRRKGTKRKGKKRWKDGRKDE